VAAKHNFPITHYIWQRLSQQKAHRPSILSKEIDPLIVFACDCVKKGETAEQRKLERRVAAHMWYDASDEQRGVLFVCHVHLKRDMLELLARFQQSLHMTSQSLQEAAICVSFWKVIGCSNPSHPRLTAEVTEKELELTDAAKYNPISQNKSNVLNANALRSGNTQQFVFRGYS